MDMRLIRPSLKELCRLSLCLWHLQKMLKYHIKNLSLISSHPVSCVRLLSPSNKAMKTAQKKQVLSNREFWKETVLWLIKFKDETDI